MSKRKLLLADDSVTIQKVVNLTFADEGIEVISVGDGDSAMQKVAEISPDLIMADVNMPGLTGYEICERIRQDENLNQTPVILLVGSFEPFDEDEARRVGANDFLTKPFQSIRQLVNKVTVLLNSQNGEKGDGATDAGSLEDTLEMDVEEMATAAQPAQYADTSFDDEMIQTNRPSSFAFDETQRFESRETGNLGTAPQFETQEISKDELPSYKVQETAAEEVNETASPADETEDDVSLQTVRSDFAYELETNSSDSYEVKDKVSKDFEETLEIPSDEIENRPEPVSDEVEETATVSEKVSEDEPVLEQIEEDDYKTVSYEIKEDEDLLESTEDEVAELEATDEVVAEEIKDYEFVSNEAENSVEVSEETISDETESETIAELKTAEETVAIESEHEQTEDSVKTSDEDIPLPEYASVLEFDDDDLLQLPPIDLDEEEEVEEKVEIQRAPFVQAGTVITPAATAAFVSTGQAAATAVDSTQISPELIEAIVAKVIERLSENAVKEVAWEVVPQMTELIVTKMAEEKLKE